MELSSLQEMARSIARTHAEKSRDQHSYLNVPDFEPHGWVIDAVHQALMMSPQHRPAEELGYEPPSSAWRKRCADGTVENRTTLQWARRATAIGGVPVADHFEKVPVEVPPTWRAPENLLEKIARKQLSETYVQRRGTRDPSVTRVGTDGASLLYEEKFPAEERFPDQVVAELVASDLKLERIVLTPHRMSVEINVDSVAAAEVAKVSAKVYAIFDAAHEKAQTTFERALEDLAESSFWRFDNVTKNGIPVLMGEGAPVTVRSVDPRDAFKGEIRHVARTLRSLMAPAESKEESPITIFELGHRWWWKSGTWADAPSEWMKCAERVVEATRTGVTVIKDRFFGHYMAKHIDDAPPIKELEKRAIIEVAPAGGIVGTVVAGTAVRAVEPQTVSDGVVVMGTARADIRRGQRIKLHMKSGDVEPHDIDDVRMAAERAAEMFGIVGSSDRIFNAACFSTAFCKLAGVAGPIDGNVVRAMLRGRRDIIEHSFAAVVAGSHFQITEPKP